jgi:hypothetical protein
MRTSGMTATAGPTQLTIFRKVVTDSPTSPPSCARLLKLAAQQSVAILVRGDLKKLRLVGRLGRYQEGNYLWVESENAGGVLDAVMAKITAGTLSVGGGVMRLPGSHLWVKNIGEVMSTPAELTGRLDIEAYNREIKGAVFKLAGGATGRAGP